MNYLFPDTLKQLCKLSIYKPMKCTVELYVAGKVFTEEVFARNYSEAKEVALARNPNAKVISVNAKF
jgi:hypothetical protein